MEAGAALQANNVAYGNQTGPVMPLEVVDLLSSDEESATDQAVPELRQETVYADNNAPQRIVTSESSVMEPAIEGSDDDGDSSDAWETESFYEDTLNEMGNELIFEDGEADICTARETATFRKQLRTIGPSNFLELNIDSGAISAKKLLTAFGILPPPYLEGAPDKAYYGLLIKALERELRKRAKLSEYNTIDDAVKLLKDSKNIVVLTGAGISTSLGIPDFRSSTGLYEKIRDLGLDDPQDVFDLHKFEENPSIFYSFAKDILPTTKKFSPTHAFIRLLQDKGKLLTNYTQNIDNIEMMAGIEAKNLIQCHGSFAFATCQKCKCRVWGEEIFDDLRAGTVARCKKCPMNMGKNGGFKRKRASAGNKERKKRYDDDSDDDDEYNIPEAGVMKPDIIFFGEDLPDIFHERLGSHDKDTVDLVVVIGTSLKVAPVADVVNFIPRHVPQIYINRDRVTHTNFDIDLLGDCDVVVAELCRRLGWKLDHEMVPKDPKVKIDLAEGTESCFVFKEVK